MGRTFATQETIRQSAARPIRPAPTEPPSHARLVPSFGRGILRNLRGHFSFFSQNTPGAPAKPQAAWVTPSARNRGIPVQDSTGKTNSIQE